jgi:hypothetical protein
VNHAQKVQYAGYQNHGPDNTQPATAAEQQMQYYDK